MMVDLPQLLVDASVSPALVLTIKASFIAAVGLVAATLARKRSAALRHLILATSLASLLLLPAASLLVPALRIAVPVASPARAEVVSAQISPPYGTARQAAAGDGAALASTMSFASLRRANLSEIACLIWALGAAIFILPLLLGLGELRRLEQAVSAWPHGQTLLDALLPEPRAGKSARILLHDDAGPMTYGVLRPAIILPTAARHWPAGDLARVLTHELEHTRRWDWLTDCGARAVCALYWFHPLVWMLQRRLCIEAERACDDAVLRASDALAYANQLVGFAERRAGALRTPQLALASRTGLATRIHAMLDTGQRRSQARRGAAALAAGAVLLVVLALSPLRVAAALAPGQQPARSFDAVSIKPAAPNLQVFGKIIDPVRLTYPSVSLSTLVLDAYGLDPWQVTGEPEWFTKDHFALEAETRQPADQAAMMRMLRSILAERFGLKLRQSSRVGDVYKLKVARGGAKLNDQPLPAAASLGWPKFPTMPLADGSIAPVISATLQRYVAGNDGKTNAVIEKAFFGRQGTMSDLAQAISNVLDAPVTDATGLSGGYNFVLQFADRAGSSFVALPTLTDALKKQLGLVLVKGKGSYAVYTVVSAHRPSGN